ncbi:hypothetical protein Ancab_040258 [Ancistrocladus abbreviatus]
MAETMLYGIAMELLKNLGSQALQEIASAWGFKDQLRELRDTTTAIKDVLLDAEEKQSGSRAVGEWLRRLQDVIYAADDLFDEFVTVASRKEVVMTGNRFTKKVRLFFSSSNQIAFAFRVARKIKKIRGKLDRIRRDSTESTQFALTVRSDEEIVVRRGREETHSFVNVGGVIGRDDDKSAVLGMLLSLTSVEENVPVISIVGIGGQGKTTLAQCVYNDEKVEKHFELRLWVCISDVFDVKEIIKKILMSATNSESGNLGMDQLQRQLREKISGKKYLLVLDDVWNDDRSKWLDLRDILMVGGIGSKILGTTRSMQVAEAMRGEQDIPPYWLGGLSEEDSWSLFAKMVFKPRQQQMNPNLVELGREIVKKCANVPLAIRTIGSLLYGKDQSKWLSLKETELANITEGGNNIIDVLKVSYHHLQSQLKHCFAYCALWPKDSEMRKEQLMRMWMAQGFIVSSSENQSLEEVGEEYFTCLLNRCFFQDVIRDERGNIVSCKMHDLMHDMAQEVARGEIATVGSNERNLNERIRHLSVVEPLTSSSESLESLLKLESLRTLLLTRQPEISIFHQFVSGLRYLRVLDLRYTSGVQLLPGSIGKLIHLRYLDLSRGSIEALPDSILNLWNLQTLNLSHCYKLTRLPEDIKKLINLRHLDLEECLYLTQLPVGITMLRQLRSLNLSDCCSIKHMPFGMGKLTAIQRLDRFVVGTKNSSGSDLRTATAQLSDLGTLNNLRGRLEICVRGKLEDPFSDEANLRSKHGLSELKLKWETEEDDNHESNHKEDHEGVLEGLQPPPNLKKLEIGNYAGERLSSWASVDQLTRFLPNLVEIMLENCKRCPNLPLFGQLPSLKCLYLYHLESVEYMESDTSLSSSTLFFPSLEELRLGQMTRLKGWWKVAGEGDNYIHGPETSTSSVSAAAATMAKEQHHLPTTLSSSWQPPSFPKLAKLFIRCCPNMTSMPLIPCVEGLKLEDLKGNLMRTVFAFESGTTPASKLKSLEIDNDEHLISIPRNCLQNLYFLRIVGHLCDLEFGIDWASIGQVFRSGAVSSLCQLYITESKDLQSLGEIGLEHLTDLETLDISECRELELSNSSSDKNGIMPWKALQNLRDLYLSNLPKMKALPDGLQYITTLQSLEIRDCNGLEGLPKWISSLTLLETLYLWSCSGLERLPEGIRSLPNLKNLVITECSPRLTERCTSPNGEDWPLIRHICHVNVVNYQIHGIIGTP